MIQAIVEHVIINAELKCIVREVVADATVGLSVALHVVILPNIVLEANVMILRRHAPKDIQDRCVISVIQDMLDVVIMKVSHFV